VLRWLPSTGVTAVVATVISSPASTYLKVVPVLRGLFRASASNLQRPTARLLGIHLEGPFLCAARRGAHDEAQLATPSPSPPSWRGARCCPRTWRTVFCA
jgi:N-acetylglucosamine-6-phosphate deacetylase